MNQNNLLATLQENRLMQTEEQVTNFENARTYATGTAIANY
ncbi:hypothetical protein [Dolichospermum compactum]|uniref:Uncharacterized protein n=1 Tax=Dolichospermum compactum NIES-806 TaxID=1973481 RepID=A0A1Z4V0X4_9CYAN|nr:hypothetical protein [Dolichospermum compactum]BAZ84955.1 hypothetical protein NIES806_11550 [Dolichospermum compactum NIES-806]